MFTNTLSVGTVETALVKYMLARNPDICETTGSVNPVVCECNDCGLNDIRGLHVTEAHVFAALADCKADFAEGAVGAGRGMRCHGLKGGIGSASRVVELDGKPLQSVQLPFAEVVGGVTLRVNLAAEPNTQLNK